MKQNVENLTTIITAGSTYLDIDAYACCVAMAELLRLKGQNALAYSNAPCNYSICQSLVEKGQILDSLPADCSEEDADYIIVDVSDPDFLKKSVPLHRVVGVYDHHVGFEDYWQERIGEGAQIEFIGAAATLIYREWKKAGLTDKMRPATARLLIAAILDNTLNLTSANTTAEDLEVFRELCQKQNIAQDWCASYFSEVQANVEADLKNAIFGDIKTVRNNPVLPAKVAQLCVWDASSILAKLPVIRRFFDDIQDCWMINIIDIRERCSYFICDDSDHQKAIESVFDIHFQSGIAKSQVSYLRKEIIKRTLLG